MTIENNLLNTNFPLPAIRQVNLAKHPTGISLGLGELKDFPVDAKITQALTQSLNLQGTSYTHNAGLPELREAVAQSFAHESLQSENVVITIGVQNALYSTIKTLATLGAKRVLIPEIHFGIYKKIPMEFNLEVISYKLTADFGIDLDFLKTILEPDDIFLLNSPANPTGRVLKLQEFNELAQVFQKTLTEGYVISDEIYGKLIYEGQAPKSFIHYFERTLVIDGISKSGAVAGLRVGWVICPNEKLAQAIISNNATIISSPPTANQFAALPVVLGNTQETINGYNKVLKQNRDYAVKILSQLNIDFVSPTGSFYIFPKLEKQLGPDTTDFCLATAKKENGVVVIPGKAFGAPSHLRISLASNQFEEGMKRFEEAINSI